MTKETLRMQMLSGVITEGEYKAKLEENSNIPNDIEWEIKDIGDWVDPPYTRALYMSGYSPSTGEEFEGFADGVDMGGGDWDWDEVEDITKVESKESLNEHYVAGGIVGVGAINNPFEGRKKEKYEDAFEHFLSQKYSLNENEEEYNQIVDNLIDNFDDSREASAGIDKLKKMGMWDEFLKSDKGATFQKLRKSLR